MKHAKLGTMTEVELIQRYIEIGVAQDEALLMDQTTLFNRLYDLRKEVEAQLKERTGDQRRLLLRLYDHPNVQVRLNAVEDTLAVEPQLARTTLETIAASGQYPQAGYAGMTVAALEQGTFKPE
jgi:enoyl reductase-like protein